MFLTFAWRYFKSKKSTNAINIISWVSILAIAVGTAALIIILSVYNGFEGFIKNLYSTYYPSLKISAVNTQNFVPDATLIKKIQAIEGVTAISTCLEEKALFTYNEKQIIAELKGVDTNYNKVTTVYKKVQYGSMQFNTTTDSSVCVVGIGIANTLGVTEESILPLNCYTFTKDIGIQNDPLHAYHSELLKVRGVFFLQDDFDNTYVFAPLAFVQQLTQNEQKINSIEIKMDSTVNDATIQKKVNAILPKKLQSATRYEQNKTLYFILKSERWAVYAILTLLLLISSFNIIGSLSMLVIEKEKDIAILKAMGAENALIKKIFISTGILLSMIGASIGAIVAFVILWIQLHFGIIHMSSDESFLIEAYPVKMLWTDFVLVLVTVFVIGFMAALFPSIKASKRFIGLR